MRCENNVVQLQNRILQWRRLHLQDIESAMRVYVKAQRDARRKLAKKKGKHLSSIDGSGLDLGASGNSLVGGGGKTRRRTSGGKAAAQALSGASSASSQRRNIFTTRANTTVYFS